MKVCKNSGEAYLCERLPTFHKYSSLLHIYKLHFTNWNQHGYNNIVMKWTTVFNYCGYITIPFYNILKMFHKLAVMNTIIKITIVGAAHLTLSLLFLWKWHCSFCTNHHVIIKHQLYLGKQNKNKNPFFSPRHGKEKFCSITAHLTNFKCSTQGLTDLV